LPPKPEGYIERKEKIQTVNALHGPQGCHA
jgi:hypothetical protein